MAVVTGARQGIGAAIAEAGRLAPLGRIAQPHMAVFLASDEASHVTGQTVHVDGGQVLT